MNTVSPPRTAVEEKLAQIWSEVLGIEQLGVHDNLFDLGGNSILATEILDRVSEALQSELSFLAFFETPTIAGMAKNLLEGQQAFEPLAEVLLQQDQRGGQPQLIEIQSGDFRRPFFFLHGDWQDGGFYCVNLIRYLGKDQPFYALPPHGIDGIQMSPTIETMAADHLKTLRAFQPEGPYLLGGFCNGGLIAFEMAQQLYRQGQKVDLLVLIEASAANARFQFLHTFVSCFSNFLGLAPKRQLKCFLRLRHYFISFPDFWPLPIATQLKILFKKLSRKINLVVSRFKFRSGSSQGCTPEKLQQLKTKLFYMAINGYTPRSYSGQVKLLRVSGVPEGLPKKYIDDLTMGWREVAPKVDVHLLPGDHLTCVTTHVKVVAEKLRLWLDEAQAED